MSARGGAKTREVYLEGYSGSNSAAREEYDGSEMASLLLGLANSQVASFSGGGSMMESARLPYGGSIHMVKKLFGAGLPASNSRHDFFDLKMLNKRASRRC